MRLYWLPVALCSFLFFGQAACGQTNNDLIGSWHNEVNATLTITAISPIGQLIGAYAFQAGTAKKTFPLIGWVNPVQTAPKKDHVVPVLFMVRLDVYGSLAVWAGYLSWDNDGSLSINTIWNTVTSTADPDVSTEPCAAKAAGFSGHIVFNNMEVPRL